MAVTVTPANVTIGADGASGDHDVKVTITSDDDAHKTAEVELSVACTGVGVEAPGIGIAKKDAAAGMAEWKGQSVKLDAATVCTYTAKALEKEATGTFTVKAEEAAANTPAINLAAITAPAADNRELTVSFAPTNTATGAAFTAHSACAAAPAPADAQAVLNVDRTGVGCTDDDSDNTYECDVTFSGTDLMCAIVVKDNATPNANMEFKQVTLTVSLTATL